MKGSVKEEGERRVVGRGRMGEGGRGERWEGRRGGGVKRGV